ncbi:IS1595 family transposase [Pikeienuella piscinae]|uniref:IS1595 family transposase n=1 Tax=Pikeienuella piscinae TaxID=2748098 RepID=A0A7L5C0A9_9RHOB|nr:IS1595 family transposase [Pikeienuella piscinae]QIE55966.1 IS1595 family transposase [Pikeienuella piscinae]
MAKADLTNAIFHDDDKAREHLESILWPSGAVCPRCSARGDRITKLQGKSTRPGVHKCKDCRKPFTVTVGTVMERSKIPLSKWVLAAQLMASSKKGMSAKQLERMLGCTYETAWFLFHRLRECAIEPTPRGPMGGANKVVEADETYVGGKARNAHKGKPVPKKNAVFTLVERDGEARSFHVTTVNSKTLKPILLKNADRASLLMTDDSRVYPPIGKEFKGHASVNHSDGEYVRKAFYYTNTVESYFALLKRGVMGSFHSISEAHLYRYLAEFDFRHNHRHMSDTERSDALLSGAKGKRLTYQQPREAANV